jgi:hypothetical protein
MNFSTMSKQRLFIIIAAVIGLISLFLPWKTVSAGMMGMNMAESTNGFRDVGIVVFLAFLAAGIISFLGDQTRPLERNMWFAVLGAGGAALLFTIIYMTKSGGDALGIVEVGNGIGLWLALLCSIAVLAFAFLFRGQPITMPGNDVNRPE